MPQRMSKICEETQEKENSPSHTDIADVGSLATKISDTSPTTKEKQTFATLFLHLIRSAQTQSISTARTVLFSSVRYSLHSRPRKEQPFRSLL